MGDSMHKREENSVRVTNLSEDTREDDLRVGRPRPRHANARSYARISAAQLLPARIASVLPSL